MEKHNTIYFYKPGCIHIELQVFGNHKHRRFQETLLHSLQKMAQASEMVQVAYFLQTSAIMLQTVAGISDGRAGVEAFLKNIQNNEGRADEKLQSCKWKIYRTGKR